MRGSLQLRPGEDTACWACACAVAPTRSRPSCIFRASEFYSRGAEISRTGNILSSLFTAHSPAACFNWWQPALPEVAWGIAIATAIVFYLALTTEPETRRPSAWLAREDGRLLRSALAHDPEKCARFSDKIMRKIKESRA